MRIPYQELATATLHAIVQEFVTRDGTDHSEIETRIRKVTSQLEAGIVEIHFDRDSGTCNIVNAADVGSRSD